MAKRFESVRELRANYNSETERMCDAIIRDGGGEDGAAFFAQAREEYKPELLRIVGESRDKAESELRRQMEIGRPGNVLPFKRKESGE